MGDKGSMYSCPVIKWWSELIKGAVRWRRSTPLPGRAEDHGKRWSGVSVRPVRNPWGTEMALFPAAAWLCVTLRTKGIFSSPKWLRPVSCGEGDALFLDLHRPFLLYLPKSHAQHSKDPLWTCGSLCCVGLLKMPFRSAVLIMHKNCCFNYAVLVLLEPRCCAEGFYHYRKTESSVFSN